MLERDMVRHEKDVPETAYKKQSDEHIDMLEQLIHERNLARKAAEQSEKIRQQLTTEQLDLQKQLSEASSALRSMQEENEMLVAQIHEIQEELENYYVAIRQMAAVMEQSESTMDRARSVIIRLKHG